MKRASHLLCVLLLFTTAFAQQLTQADRDKGVAYLQQTEDGVAKAIKGLSEGQLKFKPAPDGGQLLKLWNTSCWLKTTFSRTSPIRS